MKDARVLVVDDSASMRALFSDVLDEAKHVQVVGTASNAREALEQIETLRPNVLTLDVEMPGMSGMELLEQIMDTSPMPVVMLSSHTQSGTETSLKAYELGAVECFPKPLRATPEQFAKTVSKLGKIVHAAANSNVRDRKPHTEHRAPTIDFQWNGYLLAVSTSMGGVEAVTSLLAGFPANCPPTVVLFQTEPSVADAVAKRLNGEMKCTVRLARDGDKLTQGTVLIAADPERHAVVEAGTPPKLRLVARDAVEGVRPSANLLFASLARAAIPCVGAVLSGIGDDGAKGLAMMSDAGSRTFAQERSCAVVAQAPEAAIAAVPTIQEVGITEMAGELLKACGM